MRAADLARKDTQVAVLRWIANGCPDGVMPGYAHKITAAALRSRPRPAPAVRERLAGRAHRPRTRPI